MRDLLIGVLPWSKDESHPESLHILRAAGTILAIDP